MKTLIPLALALMAAAPQDFQTEVREAYEKLKPAMDRGRQFIAEGRLDEADEGILDTFPESTRTPAQAYVLGNLLWLDDPKASYALHKQAAEKLPVEPNVQLEWAMEQHRVGEYEGAARAYAIYSAAVPEYAVAWGLGAECLVRLGRSAEALKAWKSSEDAKKGSLETFESAVYEIHRETIPLRLRADYLAAVRKGDAEAAVALIALDGFYPGDWWNNLANKEFLEHDIAVVRRVKFADTRRMDAIDCTAACAPAKYDETGTVKDALSQYRFLTDPDVTIPSDPKLAAILIDHAVESKALGERRKAVADKVLAAARLTKNADLWNGALYLIEGDQPDLELEAWNATGDVRFAMGYLSIASKSKGLKADDEILVQARRRYPESAPLVRHEYELARRARRVTADLLLEAIKAEYHHFSSTGIVPRPKAAMLRRYFKELGDLQK